jgi:hypothetical protein
MIHGMNEYAPPIFDSGALLSPWDDFAREPVPDDFDISEDFVIQGPQQRAPWGEHQATRYLDDHRRIPQAEGSSPGFLPDSCHLLASIDCPPGSQAIVYSIECHLVGPAPFLLDYCQFPSWHRWNEQHGWRLRYYLRLVRNANPLFFAVPLADGTYLPGSPHPDLGAWWDLLFPRGGAPFPLRLNVPEGHSLQLWMGIVSTPNPTDQPSEIGGRLRALVQGYRDNRQATWNARAGW